MFLRVVFFQSLQKGGPSFPSHILELWDAVGRGNHLEARARHSYALLVMTQTRRAASASSWRKHPLLRPVATGSGHTAASLGEPTVYRGLCAGWPAASWSADRLCDAMPTVRVSHSVTGAYPRDRGAPCPTTTVSTKQFLRSVAASAVAGHQAYCHGNVLPSTLAADCPTPALLGVHDAARVSLWISGAGARSPLHYDLPNVLLCQLHGTKRVTLYSPQHHDVMRPTGRTFPALAAQDRIADAAAGEPAVAALRGFRVDLGPGDALLMPHGWWHEVESVAVGALGCVSVGINWPSIADSVPAFAPWKRYTAYPTLTQGHVLAQYYGGENQARERAPGAYSVPVF